MLTYFNNQQRGWRTESVTKDEDRNLVIVLEENGT
jgi:hypothetical protein